MRRIAVSSHQVYWEGLFHGFFQRKEMPVALIEDEGGSVSVIELHGYFVKFLDPPESEKAQ